MGNFGFFTLKGDLTQMTQWIRFDYQEKTEIGILTGDTVSEYKGGLFDSPQPTGRSMPLADVQLKAPLVRIPFLHCGITFTNVPKKRARRFPMYHFTS